MPLELSRGGRRYGAFRDTPDHRDLGMTSAPLARAEVLPPSVDLENLCGPIRDQGAEGSCTAHAGVGMREFLYRYYAPYEKTPAESPIFSPAFLYYQERLLDGTLDQGDCGSYGRTCCRALNQFGVCLESGEPYVPGQFNIAPTAEQLAGALQFKAGAYHRIANVQDMKSCLASGYVFAIGFTVFWSFENKIGWDGLWEPDASREDVLGGHEVLVIGYDDSKQAFKVRNSWGPSWGASGNFWFRFSDAADTRILMDAWIQHLSGHWK